MNSRMRLAGIVDDAPKVRMALAVLAASFVWLAVLFGMGHWLGTASSAPAPEKPLEMRVVELDPPHEPKAVSTTRAAPAAKPVAVKPPESVKPPLHAVPTHALPAAKPEMQPVQSAATIPSAPAGESKPAAESAAHTPALSDEKQSSTQAAASAGDTAAHAIVQPLPELPDDLREQAYQTVAIARFSIHTDGSTDIELIKPTPNPRLNQILLDVLRKWRFFPAMQSGHPVESKQDIRVHFNVN